MFIGAHIVAGLIVGKITHNYPLALASALFVDVDHLIPYVKHNVIFNYNKFWKVITDPSDPYGNQRNYLHSFFTWAFLSIICFLIDFRIGLVVSLGYISHLFLDLLDGSDFYPFFPFRYNFIGPVKYLSRHELIVAVVLLIIFFII